ncbi:SDR family NAD(P)-dependent oxidoreductase [Nonomuraea sp. B5E05]|uniref:SDR family NAD(P)-dependent oxidoreductase n=1 Tax=Nonomuraea sp. B5E05 TaxID=3153569 RepID=UPI0032618E6B
MGHVLVTGATGGIGRAVVGALAEAGHRVTAVGRDVGRLDVPGVEADLSAVAAPGRAGPLSSRAARRRQAAAKHPTGTMRGRMLLRSMVSSPPTPTAPARTRAGAVRI